jgi:hypothetical protein
MAHEAEFNNMEKLFVRSIQQFPPREHFLVRATKITAKYVTIAACLGVAVMGLTVWLGQ